MAKTDGVATQNSTKQHRFGFLTGGGQMAELIRAFDWSKTSVGEIKKWPHSLRTAISLMLHSPVPMVMFWGKQGVMLYNDSYISIAGKRHPSSLGSKVGLAWPEAATFNRNVIRQCLGGKALSYKDQELTLYRNKVPETVWLDLNYSPVIDESGVPAAVITIVVETTQRVLTERSQQTEVIAKEQQRLVAVTSQRNELIKLNKAKDEFIALASHQLRTPATAVKQYISLLQAGYAGTITPDQEKFLQIAYNSNERQLNIINDLLKTAQIDSRHFVLRKKRQPIADVLAEVVRDFQSAADLKQQRIKYDDQAGDSKALIDREEMKLVFSNLLENASKYSHSGSQIYVSLRRRLQRLEIVFTDSGVGIPADQINSIFDKFTRINNELSDTVTGSGLGLYWVKRVIKLHHGSISVTSKLGEGSVFTVKLPL